MITVRFPSGFSVQYNSLTSMKWDSSGYGMTLFDSAESAQSGNGWRVHVPPECIVEFVQPCRTYQAAGDPDKERLARVEKELRGLKLKISAALKAKR